MAARHIFFEFGFGSRLDAKMIRVPLVRWFSKEVIA